ncbi:hypothetical protein AB0I68_30590 [Streptomyces sp. NPDC050448]|uniref:hypothetical protein n=1 Tax=Streptomyces sp. NPDC050448 TaxID=3155404 RepID=UPI00343B905C
MNTATIPDPRTAAALAARRQKTAGRYVRPDDHGDAVVSGRTTWQTPRICDA